MTGRRPEVATIGQQCTELSVSLSRSRDAVRNGGAIELAPLTARLESLLDRLAIAPNAERKRQLPQLLALFEEVEALAQAVDEEAGRCRDEIARSGASARAIAAYAKRARN